MEEKLKIVIVDDSNTFAESIKYFIEKILFLEVILIVQNGNELIDSNLYQRADLILMDIEMPEINGIETAKQVLWRYNNLKLIAITNYEDNAYLSQLISAGFKGCVFKRNIYSELEEAIEKIMSGELYFPDYIKV